MEKAVRNECNKTPRGVETPAILEAATVAVEVKPRKHLGALLDEVVHVAGGPELETRETTVRECILDALRRNVPLAVAADFAGVDWSALQLYMALGQAEVAEEECCDFVADVYRARAEARSDLLAIIERAAKTDPVASAWLVEHCETVERVRSDMIEAAVVASSRGRARGDVDLRGDQL